MEKAGVMDALTRVLVGLYEEPERPASAIEYFLDRLGNGVPLKAEVETLQNEVSELQKKVWTISIHQNHKSQFLFLNWAYMKLR